MMLNEILATTALIMLFGMLYRLYTDVKTSQKSIINKLENECH